MNYDLRALELLADPTRRAIVERLAERPQSVADLARSLPVTQPAVSQHLARLRAAGLVRSTAQGARRIYAIDPAGLGPLRAWLDRLWDDQLAAFARAARTKEEPPP